MTTKAKVSFHTTIKEALGSHIDALHQIRENVNYEPTAEIQSAIRKIADKRSINSARPIIATRPSIKPR
jgi:hypothetical protein